MSNNETLNISKMIEGMISAQKAAEVGAADNKRKLIEIEDQIGAFLCEVFNPTMPIYVGNGDYPYAEVYPGIDIEFMADGRFLINVGVVNINNSYIHQSYVQIVLRTTQDNKFELYEFKYFPKMMDDDYVVCEFLRRWSEFKAAIIETVENQIGWLGDVAADELNSVERFGDVLANFTV